MPVVMSRSLRNALGHSSPRLRIPKRVRLRVGSFARTRGGSKVGTSGFLLGLRVASDGSLEYREERRDDGLDPTCRGGAV